MRLHSHIRQQPAATLATILCGLLTAAVNLACAQPLKPEVLFSFNGTNGAYPAGLTQGNDGNFYGTTEGTAGGAIGDGTVFQVTTNCVLTTLAAFAGTDGAGPNGLTLGNDGNFYGTTDEGGSDYDPVNGNYGSGTVFQVAANGVLTMLASFYASDGDGPNGLTLGSDGNFYGTTVRGPSGYGTVFRVTTSGVLTTLVLFNMSNGAYPLGGLTLGGDGGLYGTTAYGGSADQGTVFRVTTNGVLSTLVSFDGTNGAVPGAGLTPGRDGNFYGTTYDGGAYGHGTVFRVTTNGVLTALASFDVTNNVYPSGLTLGPDGNFYGTTVDGGDLSLNSGYGYGTMFQVTTNGVLTTLVSFVGTDGDGPRGLALGNDGNFYGTTGVGGDGGYGVIYRLRHQVSIQSFGMTTNGFLLNTLNVGGSGLVVLESSSDLMTWTPIQTNGTAAAQQFLDPTALIQPQQFYRVRQQ